MLSKGWGGLEAVWYTTGLTPHHSRPRVSAVSFLNTTPLVWGMLHGPQQGSSTWIFACRPASPINLPRARRILGSCPCFELTKRDLEIIPGTGIACHGAVRSILLISRCPAAKIRTLAADTSSRTSVELARVLLERRFGATPQIVAHAPELDAMLGIADAALIIGDPALHIDPSCCRGTYMIWARNGWN